MTRDEILKKSAIVEIDLNAEDVPPSVKNLQPLIYRDGDKVCVMEGDSPEEGIFGSGKTIEEAMEDFQKNYEKEKQDSV